LVNVFEIWKRYSAFELVMILINLRHLAAKKHALSLQQTHLLSFLNMTMNTLKKYNNGNWLLKSQFDIMPIINI
jgi:hypothetical protein